MAAVGSVSARERRLRSIIAGFIQYEVFEQEEYLLYHYCAYCSTELGLGGACEFQSERVYLRRHGCLKLLRVEPCGYNPLYKRSREGNGQEERFMRAMIPSIDRLS